jgi:hypothetical protein
MKRTLSILLAVVLGGVAVYHWRTPRRGLSPTPQPSQTAPSSASARGGARDPMSSPPPSGPAIPDGPITLANDLNRPGGTIQKDLEILDQILAAWRTNFPRAGNPWGENAEISAALSGRNVLGLELVPPNHRAFNGQHELCDRWGTPFRFHAVSGTFMEIVSAGPDKRFGTKDDSSTVLQ